MVIIKKMMRSNDSCNESTLQENQPFHNRLKVLENTAISAKAAFSYL